jgi:hypothetical protein
MIHRILEGPQACDVGKAVYIAHQSYWPPMSLEPDFVNCVRVFSRLEVVTPEQQRAFDSLLKEIGKAHGGIEVRPDVGAYLGVVGHPC